MKVYVGTYEKYNNGSLQGDWLDLEEYFDKEEFYDACRELHKDEQDPEFMFQDFEEIPEGMIDESWVSDKVWKILMYNEEEQEIILEYLHEVDSKEEDFQDILDRCYGQMSCLDYAYEYVEDIYGNNDEFLLQYFDYEAFARVLSYDMHETSNYLFR